MAVDKLVDSTQLDADLTTVADAIRTKGGTSASLAFPADFVSAIEAIETGGGGVSISWPATQEIITVGANSVTNTQDAKTFFSGYSYTFLLLISPITVSNQIVLLHATYPFRWRNNAVAATSYGTSYDGVLVEGTQYLLLKK